MPMIRSARLLVLALVVTLGLLYVGWSRPLDFQTVAGVDFGGEGASGGGKEGFTGVEVGTLTDSQKPKLPSSQTDHHANHGTTPPGEEFAIPRPASGGSNDASGGGSSSSTTTTSNTNTNLADDDKVTQEPLPEKIDCPNFEQYMRGRPGPPSAGRRQFPLVRPPPECRTFTVPAVEAYITKMRDKIRDPDLYRLFQNSFPNTLDTMVKWHGYAQDADGRETTEELSYVITGDIDAMWLRDSASQLYSYRSFLSPHQPEGNDGEGLQSLNSLWRGLINAHARYIRISPYCHSFQPPPESGIPPTHNGAYKNNNPIPGYDPAKVFDCKWELDSLASFLQVSVAYWERTHDLAFFARRGWVDAVAAAVAAAGAMRTGTYDAEGHVLPSAWTFTGWTNRGSETLTNDGLGNPVREDGMVRSAFRPSDDACIFQLFVPANMMFAKYLEEASVMMQELAEGAVPPAVYAEEEDDKAKAKNQDDPSEGADERRRQQQQRAKALMVEMRAFAAGIRSGIDRDGIVTHREFGEIFAYEVDGFGGVNLMDDANVPSLLSMPLFKYAESRFPFPWLSSSSSSSSDDDSSSGGNGKKSKSKSTRTKEDYFRIYQNTRRFILSSWNPYWAWGPALSAVGGPHLGPGKGWPMAALVAGLSAFEEESGFLDDRGKPIISPGGSSSSSTDDDYDDDDAALTKTGRGRGEQGLVKEVETQLGMVLDSTSGWGVVHESVASWSGTAFTRAWFGWANGLLGELVIRIEEWEDKRRGGKEEEGLLGRSWQ